ncbi:hypothetical protein [Pedobacter jamesrossensis]|uniref:Uncharacterized protein n=1 Tax=Pedobacter jamesrossensis TaxID=1908238 RepID=A0ABV8NRI8_9SPHI
MATLNGIVRFSGQVGDLIFYRRGKKDVVRSKSAIHQLSENSKKSGQDFGEASRNAAYIRKAFAAMVKDYGVGDLASRLTKKINEIFRSIPNEHLGHKKLRFGNLKLLEGFEFNAVTSLTQLLLRPPNIKLQANGLFELQLPKIDVKQLVKMIPRADGFILQIKLFNFDLNGGDYEIIEINDLKFDIDGVEFPGAKLRVETQQAGDRAVLIAVGISYFHDMNRKEDRRYFACQIRNCYHLKDGVEVAFIEPVKEKALKDVEEEHGLSWELG